MDLVAFFEAQSKEVAACVDHGFLECATQQQAAKWLSQHKLLPPTSLPVIFSLLHPPARVGNIGQWLENNVCDDEERSLLHGGMHFNNGIMRYTSILSGINVCSLLAKGLARYDIFSLFI